MIRFAILAGVSTDSQAKEEKGSIEDQVKTCRAAIHQLGGIESCGPYIMDGFSRTGYDSLSEAMRDIPPLGEAVLDAEANKYDVLMLDNFDRLGDLGIILSNRFKKIKKQLYSARQSGRLQDPDTYDPYFDESSDIGIGVGFLLQKYRLAKLRRGHKLGMQKRVDNGLNYGIVPDGYDKGKKDEPATPNEKAPLIIGVKNKFLQGASLNDLQKHAAKSGLITANGKPLSRSRIHRMLTNPFYAGKVYNGYKKGKNPDTLRDGKHAPLWTWDEHLQIKQLLHERWKNSPRSVVYNWTGLLRCAVCGHRMTHIRGYWRCNPGPDHIKLTDAEADALIPPAIVRDLKNYRETSINKKLVDNSKEIQLFEAKITKIQNGYESGIYNMSQAQEKINVLKSQINTLRDQEAQAEKQNALRNRFQTVMADVMKSVDKLPEAIKKAPAKQNNTFLHSIILNIEILPDRTITVNFIDQ